MSKSLLAILSYVKAENALYYPWQGFLENNNMLHVPEGTLEDRCLAPSNEYVSKRRAKLHMQRICYTDMDRTHYIV